MARQSPSWSLAVSFPHAQALLRSALRTLSPVYLEGPPGIGKSDLVAQVASEAKLPVEALYLSQLDPADLAFPVVEGGKLLRCPVGPIAAAIDHACALFLDELPDGAPIIQGAIQSLILTREIGGHKLHPGTWIVCAGNPADQGSGGFGRTLPVIGRLTSITLAPTLGDVQTWFTSRAPAGSPLNLIDLDWSATLEVSPDLLQINPPAGVQSSGKSWGAPRNWARGLALYEATIADGSDDTSPVAFAALAGSVGEECASAYLSIRQIRDRLPSYKEIAKDPAKAKLPEDSATGIAAIGILAQACALDPCAGWIYVERLGQGEARLACYRVLGRFSLEAHKRSPFYDTAKKARVKVISSNAKLFASGD